MSSIGIPGSATYAQTLTGIESMLIALPDNSSNLILAQDVRNVVYTLYDEIAGVSASVGAFNITYTNLNQSTVTVGGVQQGTTFNNRTIQQMFDDIFYPYVSPVISLQASPAQIEFGNSTQVISLNWSTQGKKENIQNQTITRPVDIPGQVSVTPNPTSFTNASGSLNNQTPILNTTTTFTFSVNDGVGVINTTAQVFWRNRRYWGKFATFVSLNDSEIINLDYSELATSRLQTRNGLDGAGQYLVFAWPTSFGSPSFVINGLASTAWTKVNDNYTFTNSFGYTQSYDVWMSNTQQNSPIATIEIK